MFRSSTIIRQFVQSLAKVTLLLKHSVKLRSSILCGDVAACREMACVLFVVQTAVCTTNSPSQTYQPYSRHKRWHWTSCGVYIVCPREDGHIGARNMQMDLVNKVKFWCVIWNQNWSLLQCTVNNTSKYFPSLIKSAFFWWVNNTW